MLNLGFVLLEGPSRSLFVWLGEGVPLGWGAFRSGFLERTLGLRTHVVLNAQAVGGQMLTLGCEGIGWDSRKPSNSPSSPPAATWAQR